MTEFVCLCGAFFKNITDLREHEERCAMMQQDGDPENDRI